MNLSTAIVLLILIVVVFLAIRSIIQDRKNGKSSCGGSCGSCGSHSLCHKDLYKEYKKQEHQLLLLKKYGNIYCCYCIGCFYCGCFEKFYRTLSRNWRMLW